MRILSLNVKGSGSQIKHRVIRNLVAQQRIQLLCIQETKKQIIGKECFALWGHCDINWVEILATNNGGGLLCINFVANVKALGDGYIYLEGLWKEIGSNVVVINVYSPCDNFKKRRLKEDLLVRKR